MLWPHATKCLNRSPPNTWLPRSPSRRRFPCCLRQIQPAGTTLEEVKVTTDLPFLLKGTLRPYQHVGLDWLANMHSRKLNGILADEMGLGKTIQTIALLAHIACTRNNWGPHLIIVPTSVMLNWEHELKKWCPAFKILTYMGNIAQRQEKRRGWTKPDAFHVCITSYKLAVQDATSFKLMKWKYLILDEAHHIKNFESKRWQTLLRFKSKRRLLLTGTPLQNNLMELWSLMHFLMPNVFESHQQFKEWFGSPVNDMVEQLTNKNTEQQRKEQERVARLHKLLRPFLLRRLKANVAKQMPKKYEHVVTCHLSKRQRELYEEFMSRSKTRETLKAGNYLSVINILMQLRKVCNHPNLFAEPEVRSPLVLGPMAALRLEVPALVTRSLEEDPRRGLFDVEQAPEMAVNAALLNLCLLHNDIRGVVEVPTKLRAPATKITGLPLPYGYEQLRAAAAQSAPAGGITVDCTLPVIAAVGARRIMDQHSRLSHLAYVNNLRTQQHGVYTPSLRRILAIVAPPTIPDCADELVRSHAQIEVTMVEVLRRFLISVPRALAETPVVTEVGNNPGVSAFSRRQRHALESAVVAREGALPCEAAAAEATRRSLVAAGTSFAKRMLFPDQRLIQYDCGKLQVLEGILRERKAGGHRALIFTQMTKMLDVLEQFLTYHGLVYLRLDGSTDVSQRQRMMDRFNSDTRIFCFILSTRSGGLGINLTGADTVIFYDSDWNPTMDAQAQDRAHRIGQTRDVHIYRLVSEHTVEENILKKANQKRRLGEIAIEGGGFTTDFFQEMKVTELFGDDAKVDGGADTLQPASAADLESALAQAEEASDRQAAAEVRREMTVELREFDESKPLPDTDARRLTSASEADSAPEDEVQNALKAQLEALRGVEKHAMQVLGRHMEPLYKRQLKEAKESAEQKDSQLKEMEERIRQQEEALTSEDEEMLFYNKDEADKAYKAYMSDTSAPELYAPPDPRQAVDQRLDVYIEPAHAMRYRVGFMLFKGTHPSLGGRTQKRRKRKSDLRRDRDGKSRRPGDITNLAGTKRPSDGVATKGEKSKRPRPGTTSVPAEGIVPAAQRNYVSLFRKRDDSKSAAKHAAPKTAKHPKRPVKTSSGGKERKDVDTNRFAPAWLIEEDWALLSAVRTYLSPTGNINWYLVSDVVNTSTSFTGRYRSRQMCRDRYFSTIMPREDGKGPATKDKSKSSSKSSDSKGAIAAKTESKSSKDLKKDPKSSKDIKKEPKSSKEAAKKDTAKKEIIKKEKEAGKKAAADTKQATKDAKPGKEAGKKDSKGGKGDSKDAPPSKKSKKAETPASPKTATKTKVLPTAKLLEVDKRQSLMDFHKHMFSAIYKAVQSRKEPKMKRTEQATSHAKVLQAAGYVVEVPPPPPKLSAPATRLLTMASLVALLTHDWHVDIIALAGSVSNHPRRPCASPRTAWCGSGNGRSRRATLALRLSKLRAELPSSLWPQRPQTLPLPRRPTRLPRR